MLSYIYFEPKFGSPRLIIWNYATHPSNSLWDIRQNHWTMKNRSQWHTVILRSNVWSYWSIIPKYDVHTSNSLQDITQNHWTMKYRSQWLTFILRSNVGSYWFIIPNKDVHTSKSLQDILDEVSVCVTLIRYTNREVDTTNTLEDIKQNH